MKQLPVIACCTPLTSDLSEHEASELESLFAALADKNRVKIVSMLLKADGETCCVCDLEPELGVGQPTVSYHLRILREAGLVDRRQQRNFAYYSVRPGALAHLAMLLGPARAEAV